MNGKILGLSIFGVAVLFLGGSMVSTYSKAVVLEKKVVASHDDLKNILGQYHNTIMEITQVPEMYRDDSVALTTAAMSGRYGQSGSKATFQWLKEHNAVLDKEVYTKVQTTIEAGRNKFTNSQTEFLDVKREYETMLSMPFSGIVLRVFAFPKVDLAKLDIVTTDDANKSFETGIDKKVQLR